MPTPRKKGTKAAAPAQQQGLFDADQDFVAATTSEAVAEEFAPQTDISVTAEAPADLWGDLFGTPAAIPAHIEEAPAPYDAGTGNRREGAPPTLDTLSLVGEIARIELPTREHLLADAALDVLNRRNVAAGETRMTWAALGLPDPPAPDAEDWLLRHEIMREAYQPAYLAALLTDACSDDSHAHAADIVDEIRAQGLALWPPQINRSDAAFDLTDDGAILTGLCAVRGLSDVGVDAILAERQANGLFADLADFCRRVPFVLTGAMGVDRDGLMALIWSGALDVIAPTTIKGETLPPEQARTALVTNYERIWQGGQREMAQPVYSPDVPDDPTDQPQQLSLFDTPARAAPVAQPPRLDLIVPPAALSPVAALRRQEAALGFDSATHPLWRWPYLLRDEDGNITGGWTLLGDIVTQSGSEPGMALKVAGMVVGVRAVPPTANSPALTVAGLEDWTGRVDVIVAEPFDEEMQGRLTAGALLAVSGTLATLNSDTPADRPTLIAYDARILADIADVRDIHDLRDQPQPPHHADGESVESVAARLAEEVYATERAKTPSPVAQQSSLTENAPVPQQNLVDVPPIEAAPAPSTPMRSGGQRPADSAPRKSAKPAAPPTYRSLFITIPPATNADADDRLMNDLDRILSLSPGSVPVMFLIETDSGDPHRVDPHRSVSIADSLLDDLSTIVGVHNVRPV